MKKSRIISCFAAVVMLLAAIAPAAHAAAVPADSGDHAVIPAAGDGVILDYELEDVTLNVVEEYGMYKATRGAHITVTASFEEGWTYNPDYTNFFRDRSDRVTVTDNPDGSKTFSFEARAGDYFSRDELLTVGIYATPDALPRLSITTSVPFSQIDRETWVDASYTLTLGTKVYASGDYSGEGSIKGRGNTSWNQPKKPYSIKLNSKASLLDIPKTKKYAIVPSYFDDSLIRNYMTYKAALMLTGIDYVPKCEFVEVYLNGQYNGIYILVERVAIESNKIDIDEANADELTGGYLIEKDIDGKIDYDSDQWFDCPYWANQSKDYFVLKTPEPDDSALLSQMLSYLTDYMQRLHNSVTGSSSEPYTTYVDSPSWMDFMILQEISKNIDGNLKTSCYMVKKAQDEKLYMTAPWDFDLAYGSPSCTWNNADHSHNDYYDCPDAQSTASFMVINSSCPWFDHLYDDHEEFRSGLMERYAGYRETMIPFMLGTIDSASAYLAGAVPRDEARWGVRVSAGVEQLRTWLRGRIDWLDSQWTDSEPIDLNFALNVEGGTLQFSSTGNYAFTGVVVDGRAAGVSGNAGVDNSESAVSLTLQMQAGQTLSFDYRISSEQNYDKFQFTVNGSAVVSADGEHGWQTYTYTAPSDGSYQFTWKYKKDYSVASGSDCVWIDNVAWSGDEHGLLGDVDGNGVVDAQDALLILRWSLELIDELPHPENGDVNGDGHIGADDALVVLRLHMGIA